MGSRIGLCKTGELVTIHNFFNCAESKIKRLVWNVWSRKLQAMHVCKKWKSMRIFNIELILIVSDLPLNLKLRLLSNYIVLHINVCLH